MTDARFRSSIKRMTMNRKPPASAGSCFSKEPAHGRLPMAARRFRNRPLGVLAGFGPRFFDFHPAGKGEGTHPPLFYFDKERCDG